MIDVQDRVGLGRTARWSVGESKVSLPNIMFHDSALTPAPSFAELTVRRDKTDHHVKISFGSSSTLLTIPLETKYPLSDLGPGGSPPAEVSDGIAVVRGRSESIPAVVQGVEAEVFVLTSGFEYRRDPREFVRSVAILRQEVGYNKIIYVPGMMEPSNLALMVYSGVDLIDTSLCVIQGSRDRVLLPEGSLAMKEASWLVADRNEDAIRHNVEATWKELNLVRHMIKLGRLRELVETRVHSTPWAVAALRLLDLEFYELQETYTPIIGPRFYANSKQSLDRPDIRRFRERIMHRYQPPEHKKILLLIPCSAKKPYSTSKTHRIFADILQTVPKSSVVEELIITSPLGTVPRELEMFYPAAQYDIPVTGHWDRDEVAMVQEMVKKVAAQGFEKVIGHLGVEMEFVREVVPDCIQTAGDGPMSRASLRRLQERLFVLCQEYEEVSWNEDRKNNMRSVARFQFGEGGEALLDDAMVVGRYPFLRIMQRDKLQRGMMTPERGMISLTMEGASTLVEKGLNIVEMEDFDLTGNLFAVGVKEASPEIRVGDEALVLRKGQLEAVGTAMMSGPEMKGSRRGEAIRVRHKRRR